GGDRRHDEDVGCDGPGRQSPVAGRGHAFPVRVACAGAAAAPPDRRKEAAKTAPADPTKEAETVSQPNAVIDINEGLKRPVSIGGGQRIVFIAGPCQLESRQHALEMANALKEI